MSKNIARLAVTAGLTAALSFGGVMAPVTMAFAEGTTGSITINKVNDANNDNTFKAYQIFMAKVIDAQDGSGKIASDVKWAVGEQAQKAIIKAIRDSKDYSDSKSQLPTGDPITAQDVADWLSANVTTTTASANGAKGTRVAPSDVLYSIAKAVINNETAVGNSIKAGDSWTCSNDGYYLFVSDGLTDTTKPNTGTSPIFAIVGGNPVTVTEKTSIPTVNKEVREGATWGNVSDSYIGEEVEYKLTGSVADNIATFNKYQYEFHDTLSKGLEAAGESGNTPKDLHVYIDNKGNQTEIVQDDNDGYKVVLVRDGATKKENLTIAFTDLKTVKDKTGKTIKVDADSKVVVTYKATLTSDAEYTATGNTNDVELVYSNNPMTSDTGTSTSKRVTDHVFRLNVTKVEKGKQEQKLEATFQVKMTKEGDISLKDGKWLTEDGGLTGDEKSAGKFKTAKDSGQVYIPGLVEGTYEITECDTPAGYNTLAPFTITVNPTYDEDGTLTGLDVTPSNTEMVTPSTTNDATIPVTIKNKKGSGLPLTGLNGVTFTWIAGGAVLCIGVAHLIRSRKQAEESEQE
ncbi:isopeptide-forming domain-containing fimbrial protein [Collinsella aerofaciens]|uniref:isopeptide-forming domain-containing fimbrial protein n=1 Tax=Collinsella aerofaciens TaxID=74426 RepID=UPI0023303A2D|nr:isopeptide-forming domain-containing fimbrial protein [Collinsella aerofaciens]MDB1880548.1 isopeptide-forming domain-containing fimbrial protein [Collinsella aerofaciens]MDB1882515.1 isopeptide-forming domain-containing fimbrial protein [Collinsella aerofaciens]MDB1884477.1 isopeptide-forming domain-containing fimbrial protein [Collinsella aerofaciens]MDB1888360.1 isopeptide-forming domain-containing fimbrial protein [Collinsella aerofaciens]